MMKEGFLLLLVSMPSLVPLGQQPLLNPLWSIRKSLPIPRLMAMLRSLLQNQPLWKRMTASPRRVVDVAAVAVGTVAASVVAVDSVAASVVGSEADEVVIVAGFEAVTVASAVGSEEVSAVDSAVDSGATGSAVVSTLRHTKK